MTINLLEMIHEFRFTLESMKHIIFISFICLWVNTSAQIPTTVTHKISVEYKDGKRLKGDILRVDESTIELRLKSSSKNNETIKTIKTDSIDVHFIKSITVSRKKTKDSSVLVCMASGATFGFLVGALLGHGSEEHSSGEVGIALAIPGGLLGIIFGVKAGFESKEFPIKGDVGAFEKALLEISERLAKVN